MLLLIFFFLNCSIGFATKLNPATNQNQLSCDCLNNIVLGLSQVTMHYTERATLCLITGVFLCCLLQTTCGGDLTDGAEGATAGNTVMNEPLTAAHKEKIIIINPDIMSFMHNTDSPPNQTVESGYDFLPASPGEAELRSDYPSDLFAIDDLRRGWVILHIIGIVYMSISLFIVCSEFFVPSLWVIQDKLSISDDVTGATFMAVGRSVPRQFSLLIGAFFGPASVGFGSLVGAAVFKILFVIGISTLLSRKVLQLTRWPFFRDMSFYLLSLVLLIVFLLDNLITWWESSMLLTVYILYVILLKFNAQVSQALKTQLHENSIQDVEPEMVKHHVLFVFSSFLLTVLYSSQPIENLTYTAGPSLFMTITVTKHHLKMSFFSAADR